jgi:hypothetical protein
VRAGVSGVFAGRSRTRTASANARLISALLTLTYGGYLLFLIVWLHRAGGITEAEEWRIFVEGWAAVPVLAITFAVSAPYLTARCVGRWPGVDRVLVVVNTLGVFAAAVALRGSSVREPLFGTTCIAVIVLFPALNLAIPAALRVFGESGRQKLLRCISSEWIFFLSPILLTLTVLIVSLQNLPSATQLVGLVVLAGAATFVRIRHRRRGRWLTGVADALVLLILTLFVFDPHLHFEPTHHNWFLGPTLALMQGRTLLVDVVSAYGVLSMYVLALVFDLGLVPLSYVGFALVVAVLVILQYAIVYVLLRSVLRSVTHAIVALAVIVLVHFIGVHGAFTVYPSAGPIRFALPYLLLLLVAFRARRPARQRAARLAERAVVALASVWSAETFFYALAAYGGIVSYEAGVEAGRAPRWMRAVAARVTWTLLFAAAAHLGLALYIRVHAGQWPHWGYYFVYVQAFSPAGEGWALQNAPRWGGWIAVSLIYFASLIGCLYSLPLLKAQKSAARFTMVFAMTLMGIAQFTYFLGLSIFYRLLNVAIPAVFVAAFWGERLSGRVFGIPRRFRLAARFCTYGVVMLVAVQYRQELQEWIPHSALASVVAVARGQPVAPPQGCPTLVACLTHGFPISEAADRTLHLMENYAPDTRRAAVFVNPAATTEICLLSGKAHVFPMTDASHDNIVTANGDRIVNAAHGLRAGDVIFVDRAALSPAIGAQPSIAWLALEQRGRSLLRRMVDRLCSEFLCEVVDRSGGVTVERLRNRPTP